MVSFENFVKSMPPSLSELKVTPSFCFAFKIPDDRAITNIHGTNLNRIPIQHFLGEIFSVGNVAVSVLIINL